jgi:hypothetical protein
MIELGYITEKEKEKYCIQLKKAMYGNIDAPLCWMRTFSKHLTTTVGLTQSKTDPCMFIKRNNQGKVVLILAVYVDDTIITGSKKEVQKAYQLIKLKFVIDILGQLCKHLGIMWKWHKDKEENCYLEATMPHMIEDIVKLFTEVTGKQPKKAATPGYPGKYLQKNEGEIVNLEPYRSIVGKLIYYMTKIGPDLSNAVRDLSAHLSNPGEEHWKSLERCVGYLNERQDKGLILKRPKSLQSISYTDSDYAKDEKDRKSISGRINTVGGMITNWSSKKQTTVSLSSTEAEYQALSECAQEAMFTRNLISEITGKHQPPAIIYEDNLGAIFLSKNSQVSARTKHIDVRHHFIRDLIKENKLNIKFIKTENNTADIMTKNVNKESFIKFTKELLTGNLPCWREDVSNEQTDDEQTNDSHK